MSDSILDAVIERLRKEDVFSRVDHDDATGGIACFVEAAPAAVYRVARENDRWFVSLATADRWLSESIESTLMHTGDGLDELIEEELVDLGQDAPTAGITVEHFRSESMLYTFRTPLDDTIDAHELATWVLAYEAAFRQLGDMNEDESE